MNSDFVYLKTILTTALLNNTYKKCYFVLDMQNTQKGIWMEQNKISQHYFKY